MKKNEYFYFNLYMLCICVRRRIPVFISLKDTTENKFQTLF